MNNNKTTRFLRGSLVGIVLLCVFVFSAFSLHMSNQSAQAINQVGTLYMSRMSQQISSHFESLINVQLNQLESLAATIPSDDVHTDRALQEELIVQAKARDFAYLGFCGLDGTLEMLYGGQIAIADPQPFLNSLKGGEKKVAIGINSQGEKVMLLGWPSPHPAAQEHNCAALVVGLPVEYISDNLALDENGDRAYSYIIRKDGSFVIRAADAYRNSYFERVRAAYGDINGMTPEEYIQVLSRAMAAGTDYSNEFTMGGERYHLYCAHLPCSEWYLITFMPYGSMDSTIRHFSSEWTWLTMLVAAVVLGALMLVFFKYLQLTKIQLRELEEARKEAEHASQVKSEFLSNMSHDIRTPMNAIVGMTAIATANLDDRNQVQNCLKKIALSSRHLLGLINNVLDMSKIESGRMTLNFDQISLREVMDSIVSIVQPQVRTKRQQFSVSIHDISSENVYCDSVRLNQVLLNLLSNAIKFTPDGGSIYLALSQTPSERGDEFVCTHIEVKDNGIGMSPEFQKRIFESFVREDNQRVHRTEGTGLGMAITKYIVDAMGGSIELRSALEQGTEFRITLDLERAELTDAEMILPNWNMLVVDDDRQLCESTVSALHSIGINAQWVLDGTTAVELVEQRHAEANDFQIILLDWKLPDMDGIETARRIRQRLGDNVPILLISAYDWAEIEENARAAGINGFISKPLFKSTLYHGLLPYTDLAASQSDAAAEQGPADLSGLHVLVAEDNELNWEIASALLSDLGLELDWVENGQLCVEKFLSSSPGWYSAILMDLRMPVMNGYEATRAIRKLDRPDATAIPIIAMTADAFADDVKRCLDAGMNAHIAKPIDAREVSRTLEKFIFH